ncbi:MAG: aminotransferase class I/II-fold pyridoxal phosphate-dependent enzyme [Acidimicrobiia bacterium]|nr:aminotransferase class I/II-fold pyridoxal phosphate-dependent enzyme [Acidimicrobiia bacterium]
MPIDRLDQLLKERVADLERTGVAKHRETVITAILPPAAGHGPRYLLAGDGDRAFIRMNSNGYLGMALRPEVIAAEAAAAHEFGTGPQAVRFISGTFAAHTRLEERLAAFHGREAAIVMSSAYATVMAVLPCLVTPETAVFSDELNHNCIINATRLAQPAHKLVYPHLDVARLGADVAANASSARRALVVTDGVFSMRGDHAPLARIVATSERHDHAYPENVVVVVDDSHGVGAYGATGRGTEEVTGARVDVLVGTLGKAFGVNGGYVVGSRYLVDYLRETAATYIYSNPITPAEAAAAHAAIELVDSAEGVELLNRLRAQTVRFRSGLAELGLETIPGEHPVVPLVVGDTDRTRSLVTYLHDRGVLATGLAYPVVPRGDDEVRFQISADHTPADIDLVLDVLEAFPAR